MLKNKTSNVKKYVFLLALFLLQAGCGDQSDKTSTSSESNPSINHEEQQNKQFIGDDQTDSSSIKVALHTKMINYLDLLSTNEAFAYLDNNSGQVEPLSIVNYHSEIFIHQNKDNYVLCVSAVNMQGEKYPVDVYIKRGVGGQLFVYDIRIGDQERESLMVLMKKSVFQRF